MEQPSLEELYQTQPQPQEMNTAQVDQMIQELQNKWKAYEAKNKEAEELKAQYAQQEELVVQVLKAIGKSKYYVEGLGTFRVEDKVSYKLPDSLEAKAKLKEYIAKKYGQDTVEGLFTINANKLNSWAKKEYAAMEEAGVADAIPGLSSPFIRSTIGFPKANEARKEGAHG